jgi:hypothetical protein
MDRIAELEAENSRLTSEANNWRDTATDAEEATNQLRARLYLVPRINKCPPCWSHLLASGILTNEIVRIRGSEE